MWRTALNRTTGAGRDALRARPALHVSTLLFNASSAYALEQLVRDYPALNAGVVNWHINANERIEQGNASSDFRLIGYVKTSFLSVQTLLTQEPCR